MQQSFSKSLLNTLIQSFATFEKQKHRKQYICFACCILDKSPSLVSMTISEVTEQALTLVLRAAFVEN